MSQSRSGPSIRHPAQRPVGTFCDCDIFTTSRQSTRFNALNIHRFKVLFNDGEDYWWGGIDDIEEGDPELTHYFHGIVEVTSRSSISDYGARILEEKGVDLSPRSGRFFVKVRGNFHRYELSGFGADRGTWITSVTDKRDPYYQTYRIASHDAHTYKRSRLARRRAWWLGFVRDCCTPSTDPDEPEVPPVRERTIKWLVQRYRDRYLILPSGVNPPSHGPPRNVHKGEVFHELARHGDYIGAALMSQRPRPMEASHWDTLQTDATHFRVPLDLDDDPQMPWEDEDEDEDMDEEEDEEGQQNQDEVGPLDEQVFNVQRDPYPHASSEMSRLRIETSPASNEGSRTAHSPSGASQTVREDFSPQINLDQTFIHAPKFDVNFTYRCIFSALPRPRNAAGAPTLTPRKAHKCPFKIDLLELTPNDRPRLPQAFHSSGPQRKDSLWDIVFDQRLSSANKHTPLLFAALMHAHLVEHQEACSPTPQFAVGRVEVEMPFRLTVLHQVDSLVNSRNYDATTQVMRYTWMTGGAQAL